MPDHVLPHQPRHDRYDAIVVGAGLGGLSAAAFLARAGLRVCCCERHIRPGGYAHGFTRRGLHFDSAVHQIGSVFPEADGRPGTLQRLLQVLGTADRCRWCGTDRFYGVAMPDAWFSVPGHMEAWFAYHRELFPDQVRGFERMRSLLRQLARIQQHMPIEPRPWHMLAALCRAPSMAKWRNATLAQALHAWFTDPRARTLVAALCPYGGLPPSRLSLMFFLGMLASYLRGGPALCAGGFQHLADALVAAVEGAGGEVVVRCPVARIPVAGGRVSGVELADGRSLRADLVVANADPRVLLDDLLAPEAVGDRYRSTVTGMEASGGLCCLYALHRGQPTALRGEHELLCYDDWDLERLYPAALADRPPRHLAIGCPSLVDDTGGTRERVITCIRLAPHLAPGETWDERKPALVADMTADLARRFPDLHVGLEVVEAATPATFERYTGNRGGAPYGWAPIPQQMVTGRLAPRTPITGLWLAGHWTRPASGVVAAATSGAMAAARILGYSDLERMYAAPAVRHPEKDVGIA